MLPFSLVNDFAHDAFHVRRHTLLKYRWFKRLCALHYLHHRDMRANYGIVTFFWDRVFGTLRLDFKPDRPYSDPRSC